jgi:outer membrane protein assembly factor BamB
MRCACAGLLLAIALPAARGDWPMWRNDATRGASTPEKISDQLELQWVRQFPAPSPAWPLQERLLFDATYEPVAAGGMIFVPSMINDRVTAFDMDSGAEKWRFYTDGPVRFAPLVWQNHVYFVSDDGHLLLRAEGG